MARKVSLPPGHELAGKKVFSRAGDEAGEIVGTQRCGMTGCRANRAVVRWPDDKITRPCLRACHGRDDGHYQIG